MQCNHKKTKKEISLFRRRSGNIVSMEITICVICNKKIDEGEELRVKKIYI